jgi:hypothetical protein
MDTKTNALLETTDAMEWAEMFIELFGDRRNAINRDLMVGWFANAIETGRRAGEKPNHSTEG